MALEGGFDRDYKDPKNPETQKNPNNKEGEAETSELQDRKTLENLSTNLRKPEGMQAIREITVGQADSAIKDIRGELMKNVPLSEMERAQMESGFSKAQENLSNTLTTIQTQKLDSKEQALAINEAISAFNKEISAVRGSILGPLAKSNKEAANLLEKTKTPEKMNQEFAEMIQKRMEDRRAQERMNLYAKNTLQTEKEKPTKVETDLAWPEGVKK